MKFKVGDLLKLTGSGSILVIIGITSSQYIVQYKQSGSYEALPQYIIEKYCDFHNQKFDILQEILE